MHILFICTGNACRSAAAESVLRKQLSDAGIEDVTVSSAGTLEWGTNPRDAVMTRIAAEHGYMMEGTTSCMTREMLNAADLILVMTPEHRHEVTRMLDYNRWSRVHLFMDYCFGKDGALIDPTYCSEVIYREVFTAIEMGCRVIVEKIIEQN